MNKDYYKVLGLERSASQEDIKQKFKKLSLKTHPDKNPGNEKALEEFKSYSEAYNTLSDPDLRKEYDNKSSSENNYHFYSDLFNKKKPRKNFMSEPVKKDPPKGDNLKISLKLTLDEIFKGITKNVNLKRGVHCNYCDSVGSKSVRKCSDCEGRGITMDFNMYGTGIETRPCNACGGACVEPDPDNQCYYCRGSGIIIKEEKIEIRVPRGVDYDQILKIPHKGNAGKMSGPPGDLFVVIEVIINEELERKGMDLIKKVNLNISDLVLGTSIKVSMLDGSVIEVKIPPGTDSEVLLRIKGKGLIKENPDKIGEIMDTGNFFVKTSVIIPKELTEEQDNLFRELQKIDQSIQF